jgi:hypothetical protein
MNTALLETKPAFCMFEMNHMTDPSSASSTISNDEYWIGIEFPNNCAVAIYSRPQGRANWIRLSQNFDAQQPSMEPVVSRTKRR